MRRSVVKQIASALSGPYSWAAALLLPYSPGCPGAIGAAAAPAAGTAAGTGPRLCPRGAAGRGDMDREIDCLALNVYFEARGEPMPGRYAVAAVTLNRVAHPDFPGQHLPGGEAGRRARPPSLPVLLGLRPLCRPARATPPPGRSREQVAYKALFMDEPDPTDGALYFHATWVAARAGRRRWSRSATSATTSTTASR